MNLSELLSDARYKGAKSQAEMAEAIGVSVTTIKSWESGKSVPTLDNALKWFESAGVNPVQYLMRYAHPDVYKGRKDTDADEAFKVLVDNLNTEDKYALLYLFMGNHGSSPSAILQMLIAHLHNPIHDRIPVAGNILIQYELNESNNDLISNELPFPDKCFLRCAIESAIDACGANKCGYMVHENRAENRAEKESKYR